MGDDKRQERHHGDESTKNGGKFPSIGRKVKTVIATVNSRAQFLNLFSPHPAMPNKAEANAS